MITIKDWFCTIVNEIDLSTQEKLYDLTFTSRNTTDEREDWTSRYISNVSKVVKGVSYDPNEVILYIGDTNVPINDYTKYSITESKILIDATSLTLPDLIYLFMILKNNNRDFDVIYAQPSQYNGSINEGIDKIETYELSDDGVGVQQLPPFVGLMSNSIMMIFLGFEGHRVGALLQTEELNTDSAICLLGIPAYKLGWENVTLSNNYDQLNILRNNKGASFELAGANDPLKVYEVIKMNYNGQKYDKKKLCLAPLGTKPATIAAAQFAANNGDVIVIYDFVEKKKRRSLGTDLVHIWKFGYSRSSE